MAAVSVVALATDASEPRAVADVEGVEVLLVIMMKPLVY
jgi:hypothetical protein